MFVFMQHISEIVQEVLDSMEADSEDSSSEAPAEESEEVEQAYA